MTQIKGNFKLISRFDLCRCHGSRPGVNTRSICSPYDISFDTGTQRMFYFPKFSSCFTLFLHKIDSFKSENIILFWLIQTTFSKLHPQGAENSKFMPWMVHSIFKNVFGPPVCNIIAWEPPVTRPFFSNVITFELWIRGVRKFECKLHSNFPLKFTFENRM